MTHPNTQADTLRRAADYIAIDGATLDADEADRLAAAASNVIGAAMQPKGGGNG